MDMYRSRKSAQQSSILTLKCNTVKLNKVICVGASNNTLYISIPEDGSISVDQEAIF